MIAVETSGLTKRFGATAWALRGVDLRLPRGAVVGLLGSNGSGKSTLLRILAGLQRPTSGTVRVLGEAPGLATKVRVAYVPDGDGLYPWMTGAEAIEFFATFFKDLDRRQGHELLKFMGLPAEKPSGALSRGQRARLKLAIALARKAELLLLDEPLGGIDPPSRDRILSAVVREFRAGESTILFSTHEVSEAEALFDHVVFLREGTVARQGPADALREETGRSIRQLFEEVM